MLNPDSIRCCGTTSSHVTSGCQRDSCSGAVKRDESGRQRVICRLPWNSSWVGYAWPETWRPPWANSQRVMFGVPSGVTGEAHIPRRSTPESL